MTLIKWNTKTPSLFNEIDSFLTRPTLFNEIDRFFNSVSTQFPTKYEQSSSWVPQFEVLNTEKAYSIRADLPGMIKKDINQFIEIGPGKVLSGLIKRIDKNVKINTINNESDIKDLKI